MLNNKVSLLTKPNVKDITNGFIKIPKDPKLAKRVCDSAKKLANSKYSVKVYLQKVKKVLSMK